MAATWTARLALEDGTVFHGRAFGAIDPRTAAGEVVFNTAMTGYQEAISDPSYCGQILTMTATQIGNCGINDEDVESDRPLIRGLVVRELSRRVSNQRSCGDLSSWLARHGITGIEGVDTRALVRLLRTEGSLRGVISTDPEVSDVDLVAAARMAESMVGCNLAADASVVETKNWIGGLGDWTPGSPRRATRPFRVLALDCGAKRSIYRNLTERGCAVTVAPHDMTVDDIRGFAPDGLFISNGPGDPSAVPETVEILRAVAGEVPTFGICLGHQLLALALGGTTFKLKFGHRGANQPVRDQQTGRVEITSQNHGFCVETDALAAMDCEPTHVHLNDGTLAGFRHRTRPIMAVQFHPEASPGPHDTGGVFDRFVAMMEGSSIGSA